MDHRAPRTRALLTVSLLTTLLGSALLAGCGGRSSASGPDPGVRSGIADAGADSEASDVGSAELPSPSLDLSDPPPPPPPPPRLPACLGLSEDRCLESPGCQVDSCYDCTALRPGYLGCRLASEPPSDPGTLCPTAPASCRPCEQLDTREACDANASCHSVFYDPGTCDCATSGCCTRFSYCARGSQADCVGPATCLTDEEVYCEAPYVHSYASSCYEGCVLPDVCAGPTP